MRIGLVAELHGRPDGAKQPDWDSGSRVGEDRGGTRLRIVELGFSEVRCDLTYNSTEAVLAMKDVVDLVHSA